MSQKRKPRFTVTAAGKDIGHVVKGKAAWHFQVNPGVWFETIPSPKLSLKDLTAEIEQALRIKGIQFRELPAVPRPSKKRPKAHGKRRKLSSEEWSRLEQIERKQARFFPRTVSLETRDKSVSGRPIRGGLPGLGKR